jgi:hypothetical protein
MIKYKGGKYEAVTKLLEAAETSKDEIIHETLGRGVHNEEHVKRIKKNLMDAGFSEEEIYERIGI